MKRWSEINSEETKRGGGGGGGEAKYNRKGGDGGWGRGEMPRSDLILSVFSATIRLL